MNYKELHKDLFTVPNDYYFAQCISADFAMGKGIAVEFNKRFNTKNCIKTLYPDYLETYKNLTNNKRVVGESRCLLVGNVLNLITKERYYDKPTYESMRVALLDMHDVIVKYSKYEDCVDCIKRIAMPKIGCGLDGLNWNMVSLIIQDIFADLDIEILVCYQ